MYINTFKYKPEDVACILCAEYVKKLGCTALSCPCLAERMEAGVVGYAEAVAELFPLHPRLTPRILCLVAGFPGSLWQDEQHKRRFAYLRTLLGYRKKRDTPVFLAALYLLTSNKEIGDRSFNCFTKGGIDFRYARRRGISQHDYTLLMGAKSLYCGTDEVTKGDLAEPQIVGDEAFRLLINALLIARYLILLPFAANMQLLYFLEPGLIGLVNGIVYVLMIRKCPKIGTQFIIAALYGTYMLIMGSAYAALYFYILAIVNELIMLKGGYQSKVRPAVPHVLMWCMNAMGSTLNLFLFRASYFRLRWQI